MLCSIKYSVCNNHNIPLFVNTTHNATDRKLNVSHLVLHVQKLIKFMSLQSTV